MLADLKNAIADYFEGEAVPDGLLPRIKTVKRGPIVAGGVALEDHPLISIYHARTKWGVRIDDEGEHVEFDPGEFALEIYTAVQGHEDLGALEDEILDLLISRDKKTGLIVALARRLNYDVNGTKYLVVPKGDCEEKFGSGSKEWFSFGLRLGLTFKTISLLDG